jgi:hypothetical protein
VVQSLSIRLGACLTTLLFAPTTALAEALDPANPADSQVIATVALFERVKNECAATVGMTPTLQTATSTWESANYIDRVRPELSRLAREPATRSTMQSVDSTIDAIMASAKGQSCSGLQRLVSDPSSSIAARAARLAAAAPGAPAPPAPPAAANSAAPPGGPLGGSKRTGVIERIAEQIEGFAFDTRAGIGVGGMVSIVVYPVVLFKDGQVLTNVEGLGYAGGPDAHRRDNPQDWSQWRRANDKIQTMKKGAWADLPFNAVYSRVPEGFSLSGRYQRTGGAGNVAMGGTDAVTTWETYDFFPGGRVIKGGGAGVQASGGDFSTVAGSTSADRRGRYSIDGLTLQLTYDDGSSESAVFVTDPQNPKVIWLNGRDFRRLR